MKNYIRGCVFIIICMFSLILAGCKLEEDSIAFALQSESETIALDCILEDGEAGYTLVCSEDVPPTAVPTNTPEPEPATPTAVPTVTAVPPTHTPEPPTPTITPPPSPTPSGPVAGAPLCTSHDPNEWHGLWNENDGCHYNHEHKHNPNSPEMVALFGEAGDWWEAGTSISYPWQTFVGANGHYPDWSGDIADLENEPKHNNYGWITRIDIPDHGRDVWIRAFRLQYHAIGAPPGTTTRFHSFSLEAQVCNDSTCGIVRTGGWLDFGNLEINGQQANLVGEEDAVADTGRRRIHFEYDDVETHRVLEQFPVAFFWYGRNRPISPPFNNVPLDPVLIALAQSDAWANTILGDEYTQHFICPNINDCDKNGSRIQAHVVGFEVPVELDIDGDGIVNYTGYTDRYGRTAEGCTAVGVDCVPLTIENAPVGRVQHRDDTHLGIGASGSQEFDVSPAGEWWIEFPN